MIHEFNGKKSLFLKIQKSDSEDAIAIARDIRARLAGYSPPRGIEIDIWDDATETTKNYLSIMIRNGILGFTLVFLFLVLMLDLRLATWVAMGVPITFFGAFIFFDFFGVNFTFFTLLALVIVLGIVVDDAIVVGERVYAHEQMNKEPMQAAVEGTWEVSVPVIFGVLTTIAAFLPLIMVDGQMSGFFAPLGWIVIFALICSIIESQLILPSHLAHRSRKIAVTGFAGQWNKFQGGLAKGLQDLANKTYRPFLESSIRWRYATATTCLFYPGII